MTTSTVSRTSTQRVQWSVLVASTAGLTTHRADVEVDLPKEGGLPSRLIVQVYDRSPGVGAQRVRYARPVAASATVAPGDRARATLSLPTDALLTGGYAVAWLEPGAPEELEFGGLERRPPAKARWATAPLRRGRAHLSLTTTDPSRAA